MVNQHTKQPVDERFWSLVNKEGPWWHGSRCWLWLGRLSHGYGRLWVGRMNQRAHRLSYQWSKGQIDPNLELDHLCRIRHCVNPEHLESVTAKTNNLRGIGVAAQCARKTHCIQGHPFNEANAMLRPNGHRRCKTCQDTRNNKRYAIAAAKEAHDA